MTPTNEALTILQRSVCLTLRCHYFGNTRRVDLAALELKEKAAAPSDLLDGPPAEPTNGEALNTDPLRLSKKLVDPKELREPMRIIGKAKSYLRSRAISAHRIFGERTYLLPVGLTLEVDATMHAFREQLAEQARAIADRWPDVVAAQAAALGTLFDATQYATAEEVERAFAVEWDYVSFAAPDRLETVDRAIFEASRDRYERRMADAYQEVRLVLRETLRELTSEITAKLSPDDAGKPRVFRTSILAGLTDFLSTFELRNIADDGELEAVVGRIRALTEGVDHAGLRDEEGLREAVRAGMAEATAQLEGLVVTSRRQFDFGAAA